MSRPKKLPFKEGQWVKYTLAEKPFKFISYNPITKEDFCVSGIWWSSHTKQWHKMWGSYADLIPAEPDEETILSLVEYELEER